MAQGRWAIQAEGKEANQTCCRTTGVPAEFYHGKVVQGHTITKITQNADHRPEFNTTFTGAQGRSQSKLLSKSEFDGLLRAAAE